MYIDSVNVGPICTALDWDIEYCESPAVKKVLAWRRRDGETVDGKLVDNLAPEVVMAKFISGTASSIRVSKFLMSLIMSLISASLCPLSFEDLEVFRMDSSEAAALANRFPSAWISHLKDFVRATADSRDVLPRAALERP